MPAITTLGRCKVDLSFFHDQSTLLEGQNERNQTMVEEEGVAAVRLLIDDMSGHCLHYA